MANPENPFASPSIAPVQRDAGPHAIPFESAQGRGTIAALVLAMQVLTGTFTVGMSVMLLRMLKRAQHGEADVESFDRLTQLESIVNVGELMLLAMSAIAFIIWMHRAYKNVIAFNTPNLRYSPGWAVGGWFVPFLNLARPYQVMREIALASNPAIEAMSRTDRERHPTPAVINCWWTFFLVRGVLSRVANNMLRPDASIDDVVAVSYVNVFYGLASCAAAALAIATIRRIDRLQLAKAGLAPDVEKYFRAESI
jgi:hypothetical protein